MTVTDMIVERRDEVVNGCQLMGTKYGSLVRMQHLEENSGSSYI